MGQNVEAFARLAQTATGRGLADAVDFTAQYLREPEKPQPIKPAEPKWAYEYMPRAEQEAVVARLITAPLTPFGIAQAYRLNSLVVAQHGDVAKPVETFVFGGPDFAISATMTPKGAGVDSLTLNDFDAADKYGLPVRVNGKPAKIQLVTTKAGEPPAFAMFHYARPDDNEAQPLDTLGRVTWRVEKKTLDPDRHEVVFATELPEHNVRIFKTFSLAKHEYHIGLTVRIEKLSTVANGQFRYQLVGACGLPIEGEWYATTYRVAHIGLVDQKDVMHRLSVDNMTLDRTGGSDRFRRDDKRIVYAASAVQFFASAIAVDNLGADGKPLAPDQQKFVQFARATLEAKVPNKPMLDDITVRAIAEPVDISNVTDHRYVLYHGPVKVRQLTRFMKAQGVDPALVERYCEALRLNTLTDYGSFGWWTSLIIFFTNVVHWLVGILHSFLPGGLAIICVTLIVRACMFPMSRRQALHMQEMQEKMKALAPEMKEIEKKYKEDFFAKQQAQRELYRKHNVNPAAGLSGCLMLLAQMPIFMGLYFALQESVFFRLEPFLWIRNLTAPDMLVWWGEKIPYISDPSSLGSLFYLGPYFNLLPIIGAVLIFLQQKKSMPEEMTDEQRQQFQIMKFMTGFMVLMFYKIPAGLSLYFIVSSIWGLAERKLVKKHIDARAADRAAGRLPKAKAKLPGKTPSRFAQWWERVLREASKK
jgi:YidC/Oxa1 family membrane protein insertase